MCAHRFNQDQRSISIRFANFATAAKQLFLLNAANVFHVFEQDLNLNVSSLYCYIEKLALNRLREEISRKIT